MAEKKITKAMRFADIAAMLHGEPAQYGTTIEEADKFIAHEVELLSKKNSAERKETAKDKENRALQDKILAFLKTQTSGVTCTQIGKGVDALHDQTLNKVVGLMRGIVANEDNPDRPVVKSVVKGVSLFSINPAFIFEGEGE